MHGADSRQPKHAAREKPRDFRHGHEQGRRTEGGVGRSLRPGTAVPPTILISDMGSGAVYLEGWRVGPSVYLTAEDAAGLRRELAKAFGADDTAERDEPALRPHE